MDEEPVGDPASYGDDRLFIYFRCNGGYDEAVQALQNAGHPTLIFDIADPYELGAEFYRWEVATAIACSILRVNAFNQPDVQDSKDRTKTKLNSYSHSGNLEENIPVWEKAHVKVFSPDPVTGKDLMEVLDKFLKLAGDHDYVAINAYLPRDSEISQKLQVIRLAVRNRTGCATTVGFGPRFLHSTGQFHKGGPDNGLFLQITAEPSAPLEIPNEKLTFGILERAQILGDYEALVARGRKVLQIHLPNLEAINLLKI